jgi:hypothetical protein
MSTSAANQSLHGWGPERWPDDDVKHDKQARHATSHQLSGPRPSCQPRPMKHETRMVCVYAGGLRD